MSGHTSIKLKATRQQWSDLDDWKGYTEGIHIVEDPKLITKLRYEENTVWVRTKMHMHLEIKFGLRERQKKIKIGSRKCQKIIYSSSVPSE